MSYRGIVKAGVVVLEPNVHLAEGQAVEVVEVSEPDGLVEALPGAGQSKEKSIDC